MIQDTCVLRKLTRVAFNNSLGGLLTHWRCSHSLQGYRHSCVIKVIALMAPQSIRIVIFLVLLRYSSEENRYIEKHFSFQRILCVIYRKNFTVCMYVLYKKHVLYPAENHDSDSQLFSFLLHLQVHRHQCEDLGCLYWHFGTRDRLPRQNKCGRLFLVDATVQGIKT